VSAVTDFSTRPATAADAPDIYQLVATVEHDLNGQADINLDVVAGDLTLPALDLARDTLLVHDSAGKLVGWAWVHLGRRAMVDVHPDHRGRGLGTQLLAWTETRARELGSERLGQTVMDSDPAAATLLRAYGYEPLATSWLLEIAMTNEPVVPEPSAGITIRPFRAGDERAVYQMTEDAFDEWQQRRRTYEEWARLTVELDTFAPALSPLAFAGDQLVGAVLSLDRRNGDEGYVDRVAVHRGHRNQGIARTLLYRAFRDFYRLGRRSCVLWTHSDTGALSLYERVGMTIRRSSTVYSKPLRDG
jgi:mycothiol synthase